MSKRNCKTPLKMNNNLFINIIRFIILVLFQVLILNNVQISGYINPYFYVLFVLMLPFETPGWLLLLSGFLLGLVIDLFMGTAGIHAATTTFMAFLRPGIIRGLSRNREIEADMDPSIRDMGFRWFFAYSFILIFFHHLLLFYLEIFRMNEFFSTLLRVLVSTLITFILVVLSQILFSRRKKRPFR